MVPDLGFYFSLIGGIVSLATSGFFYIAAKHMDKSDSEEDLSPHHPSKMDPHAYESAIVNACIRASQHLQQQNQQQLNNQYCGSQAQLVDFAFGNVSPTQQDATTKVR